MRKRILIFGIASLFILPLMKGQQEINYTMFMFNKLAINPAYAGSVGALRISGHHRNQWTAFEGAPKNFTVSAHTPLFSDRMGAGVTITSDKTGIVNENIAELAYSYRVPFNKETSLSVGISGIFQYKRFRWNETNPLHVEDPGLPDVATSRLNPNFGVGAYFQSTDYYVGVSVPRLFRTTFYNYTQDEDFGLSASRTIFLMGGVVKELTQNIKLQPGVLVSLNSNTPFEMDINMSLVFMDKVWAGVSYRLEDSLNAIFQVQATEQIKGAISFDFTLSELSNEAASTFELMLQYTMTKSSGRIENIRYF